MKRIAAPILAGALVAAGVVGDRLLAPAPAQPVDAANPVTGTTYDALTEHAFAVASPSVVYINNVGVGSGSGVIYDSAGNIVTNAHVVESAKTLQVTLANGKTYAARIVGTDPADDLAVIHINAKGLPAARFAKAGTFSTAQTVLAIGSPLGLQQSVTSGLISALGRTVQEGNGAYLPDALQTSAPINPGNSGGALVTLDGTVVGIPTLEASDPQNNNGGAAQGIGFAVPSTRVTFVAHQFITTGHLAHTGRAYLGVSASDPQAQSQSDPSLDPFGNGTPVSPAAPTVAGAVVNGVGSNSPAGRAGVQQGDTITAFNGTAITGQDDLLTALAHQKPGATVTLTLNRNGRTVHVKVQLGELPAS
jgi:S1-C subfamily serine protease